MGYVAVSLLILSAGQVDPLSLPSEAELPGQPLRTEQLPAESELPAAYQTGGDQTGAGQVGAGPLSVGQVGALPAESLLPASWAQAGDQPDADLLRQAIDGGRSPDGVPWLSLNLKGHTGPVRALAFADGGTRLFSAGEDKRTHVWSVSPIQQRPPQWEHDQTVRWQVQRGPRGRIECLATRGRLLAIAGYGAWGTTGEILLVDSATGRLITVLRDEEHGNRDVIGGLSISPDPARPAIAAVDVSGRAVVWTREAATGNWSPKQLHPVDREQYGTELAAEIRQRGGRVLAAIALPDPEHAVVPIYEAEQSVWRLESIHLGTGEKQLIPLDHRQVVTAMAVSGDGSLLATADGGGALHIWDLKRNRLIATESLHSPCLSLSFQADGGVLVTGHFKRQTSAPGVVLWQVSRRGRLQRMLDFASTDHVRACRLSPDGRTLAYSDGNDIVVQPLAEQLPAQRLRAPLRLPRHVAFAADGSYRIAIGFGERTLDEAFDCRDLQLSRTPVQRESWLPPAEHAWSVERDSADGSWHLSENGSRRAALPIDPKFDGMVSATHFLVRQDGRPHAVAVGTTGNSNIYVCGIANVGVAEIRRVFRGHESQVNALAVSRDQRYLVSAGQDGTIRFWPLPAAEGDAGLVDRWGGEFEARDGKLVVSRVLEAGPVYARGLRVGDEIEQLTWFPGPTSEDLGAADEPDEMLQRLRSAPWNQQLVFSYVRGRAPAKAFQIFPAWQQLATLLVAENREWAFWAPAGFYDASFEGHKLFGWQINRGVARLPDYFLSGQLRKALERPAIMSRLLEAGSIERAFEAAHAPLPAGVQRALVNAYRAKPHVTIVSPSHGGVVAANEVTIEATIETPAGSPLAGVKAFANGVVARLVERRPLGDAQHTCRWVARLPADRHILLQVIAATQGEMTDVKSVSIEQRPAERPDKAKLFVASAGIDNYLDAQIPRLEYAARNALELAAQLKQYSSPLYRPRAMSLTDRSVTRSNWLSLLQQYRDELAASAGPDDVLVIFLSGHGLRDEGSDAYFFVASNARYADVRSQQFASCISIADLARFSDIPCKKVVILDTCHSGAIQPLRQRQLKAALRALQDDVFLTLTASEGHQEAAESREARLGRFTNRLLEAIAGAADAKGGNGDGVVTWSETVAYVQRTVAADSTTAGSPQFPTAGPAELLEVADFPLSKVRSAFD